MKFCPNCGTERYNKADYCYHCAFSFKNTGINYQGENEVIYIPADDLNEIKQHLESDFNTHLNGICKTKDKFTYIVLTDNQKIIEIEVGGFKIKSTVLDRPIEDYDWNYDISTNPMEESFIETSSTNNKKEKNKASLLGLVLGVSSIFLAFLGIIPLVGLIASIVGIATFDQEKHKAKWMGYVGLILNILYLLSNAYYNGHFG